MVALPNFQNDDRVFQMMQSSWSSHLNPVLANPMIFGRQINNVSISSGSLAVINHLLARSQQGWMIVDQNAPAKIARVQPLNDKTLTLSSDAAVTVSVWCY